MLILSDINSIILINLPKNDNEHIDKLFHNRHITTTNWNNSHAENPLQSFIILESKCQGLKIIFLLEDDILMHFYFTKILGCIFHRKLFTKYIGGSLKSEEYL